MSTDKLRIRVKGLCLFVHEGRILAMDGRTLTATGERPVQAGPFYRLMGGSLNFYEKAEDGIRREIREELQSEIEHLQLLEVVENLYEYAGEQNHEIMFVFKGEFSNKELYAQNPIHITDDGYSFDAVWVTPDEFFSSDMRRSPNIDYTKYLG